MATDPPSYEDVLAALMGLLGTRVVISAQGAQEDDAAVLFFVTGTLEAGWDAAILDELGAGDVAIFRLVNQTFAASLERETFREARIEPGRVHVRLGNIWMEFGPPDATDEG